MARPGGHTGLVHDRGVPKTAHRDVVRLRHLGIGGQGVDAKVAVEWEEEEDRRKPQKRRERSLLFFAPGVQN